MFINILNWFHLNIFQHKIYAKFSISHNEFFVPFLLRDYFSILLLCVFFVLLRFPMAETPRHGDMVADIENVLRTVFVFINVWKTVCNFWTVFVTVMKKLSATLDIFPLRHCTHAWKFSAFRRKFPSLKTVFVVSEINVNPVRNRIQKFLSGWIYPFAICAASYFDN